MGVFLWAKYPCTQVVPETNTVAHVRGDAFQRIMAPRGPAARSGIVSLLRSGLRVADSL